MKTVRKMVALCVVVGLAALSIGCAGTMGGGPPPPGGKPPVITHHFAREKGMSGDVIKIYLAAEAPDGGMMRIATQVTQSGYGMYPADWLYLKEEYQQRFVGYLQWNTGSGDFLPEWTRISINISVYDRWGRQSNQVVLPYEFVTGASSGAAPPAPFDQPGIPRLGYIDTNLRNPNRLDRL
jgi:hypothetical protein